MNESKKPYASVGGTELSLWDITKILLAKIHWLLLAGVVVAAGVYAVVTIFVTPTYESRVSFYVYNSADNSSQGTINNSDLQAAESLATTYSKILASNSVLDSVLSDLRAEASVYKGYKRDKIEMRGDRAEISDFPLYLNTVAGGLDRRDQTIGGFSFVVKIYALPVVEIIGQLLYLLGRYGFNAQFGDCL